LRCFAISPDGDSRLAKEIPATTSFRRALFAFLSLLVLAALSAAYLVRRTTGGEDVGWWWLSPGGCVAVAFLIAAAFFGMHARLPASGPYYGEWVGLPGPSEGDASGHTMPGFVKAAPVYGGFMLFFCVLLGTRIAKQEVTTSHPLVSVLGGAAGAVVWWAIMLCYSRGWVKVKDGEPD